MKETDDYLRGYEAAEKLIYSKIDGFIGHMILGKQAGYAGNKEPLFLLSKSDLENFKKNLLGL